ncbi:RNA polymerase sigma factor [Nocardia sp. NPDC059240]|uniref:RNA polymerase sigma factor n=1 Tax=Nocardia sp. NPDC059240 TaxID=3346786 RepID=UPI0036CF2E9A
MSTWESLPWAKQIEALFRQHAEKAYRSAVRGLDGDLERAKDVVQQVFLSVCKQYEADFHDKPTDQQVALILKMTHCRVIDHWREVGRARETLSGELEDLDRSEDEATEALLFPPRSDRILEDDQLRRFWEVLTRDLTRMEYRVALMTWEMEQPAEAIADALNTSVPAVRTHRSRARRKIKGALAQYRGQGEGGAET